jgi:putative membrane-bound dehydrogenase-like protein
MAWRFPRRRRGERLPSAAGVTPTMIRTRPFFAFLAAAAIAPAQQPTHVPPEAFDVPAGLEVTVWATSPLLQNPTNMDVDHRGRIWVTEGVNYRGKARRRPAGDRVMVLEDRDGDGVAETSTVFVQEPALVSPLGIAVFDNVVVVSQPPELLVYTDVDRDLEFDPATDTREVRLSGFQGRNHDHSLHSVTAGPDGRWYWNSGNCGAIFTDRSGYTFRITSSYMDPEGVAGTASDDGHVYVGGFTARMQPDGSAVEIIGHNYRNSYEQVVTSLGDVFHSDNDDPPACRVTHVLEYGNAGFSSRDGQRSWRADQRHGQDTPTAEWRQDDPGTMPAGDVYGGGSPTGVAFYENGALDPRWQGMLLACEPGRNTVFGYFPERDGASYRLERFDFLTTNSEHRFVGSDFTGGRWDGKLHTQFRPSDVCVGADGTIYVADWFDGRVGGHQTLDDARSGTIYRIVPTGENPQTPELDLDEPLGQMHALASPAVNVRHLGFRRLRDAGDDAQPLLQVLTALDDPFLLARATWLQPLLGEQGAADARGGLVSERAEHRLVTFRALRNAGDDVVALAGKLCRDEAPFVRAAVATALRDAKGQDAVKAMVEIGRRFDGKDRAYLDAFGIGCTGKQEQVYRALAEQAGEPTGWDARMAWIAWRLGARSSVPALVARARHAALPLPERTRAVTALAFVRDLAAADAMLSLAGDFQFPLRDQATWWCLNRMGNEWSDFGVRGKLKERGIYDPDAVEVQAVQVPPEPDTPLGITVAQVLALTGDAKRGAARAGTCYTCHKVGDMGIAFGPDLTAFGKAQSRQAIVEAILLPSKSISHGYEGHTVETDDGNVDGIVLSRGDPVIVQSQAGLLQLLPKAKVKKIRRMQRSLMWPPQLFGLDAQAIADLVAWLKEQP